MNNETDDIDNQTNPNTITPLLELISRQVSTQTEVPIKII
jgi:hypothetical protein